MVKKLALVGTGVAAVLIAVSPLAFATEKPAGEDKGGGDKSVIGDVNSPTQQNGLVNLGDVNALNGVNVCPDVGVLSNILSGGDTTSIACESLSGNNND